MKNILSTPITVDSFLAMHEKSFPMMGELKNTPQDPIWHAEGNVHIHTDMVLEETYAIIKNEAKHLSDTDKETLIWAALFHDICKPITTREVERFDRICVTASRHETMGMDYLFFRLRTLIQDQDQFQQIISLVGYHQLPKLLVVKDQTQVAYQALARKARLDLLYYLELADMRGRTCIDQEEQIEYIELFKAYAEDFNLFGKVNVYQEQKDFLFNELSGYSDQVKDYVFSEFCRNIESGLIYTPEEELSRSYQYRDAYSHLIITCGLSGSGKTTYIKENYDYEIISLDAIRQELLGDIKNFKHERKVRDHAKDILKKKLAKKENVIWDATNYRADFRAIPLTLGFNYNAYTEIALFNLPFDDIIKQDNKRKDCVGSKYITKQFDKFQVPSMSEAHNINLILK
jgi:putative nucleotidyltransferase with HDIG domain